MIAIAPESPSISTWPSGGTAATDLGGDHAAGARHVLDHERLAERAGQLLREQPGEHVRVAAGRGGGHEPHRPIGIVGFALREGAGRRQASAEASGKVSSKVARNMITSGRARSGRTRIFLARW